MDLYFSDHFKVKPQNLEKYGAFNISLVADLPLFIDPFLLFNSRKKKYKQLHSEIIRYLIFLRDKASEEHDKGKLKSWYAFKEVEQNWLGFSVAGNKGSALGMDFARALNENLNTDGENVYYDGEDDNIFVIDLDRLEYGKDIRTTYSNIMTLFR